MNNNLRAIFAGSRRKDAPAGIVSFKNNLDLAVAKNKLAKTNDIFIQCAEAAALGQPSPYSQEYLEEVGAERQALRDKITELEAS